MVHVYAHMCVRVCACVGQRLTLGVSLNHVSPCVLRQALSLTPDLTYSGSLTGKPLYLPFFHPYRHGLPHLVFDWFLGLQMQIFIFIQQMIILGMFLILDMVGFSSCPSSQSNADHRSSLLPERALPGGLEGVVPSRDTNHLPG